MKYLIVTFFLNYFAGWICLMNNIHKCIHEYEIGLDSFSKKEDKYLYSVAFWGLAWTVAPIIYPTVCIIKKLKHRTEGYRGNSKT